MYYLYTTTVATQKGIGNFVIPVTGAMYIERYIDGAYTYYKVTVSYVATNNTDSFHIFGLSDSGSISITDIKISGSTMYMDNNQVTLKACCFFII